MNAIIERINGTGQAFVEFAVPMLIQSGVLILILLLVDLLLRKRVRAVFRYWIWMLVLVKLVLPTSLSSPISVGRWFGDELAYMETIPESTSEPGEDVAPVPVVESPPIPDIPHAETVAQAPAVAPTETIPRKQQPVRRDIEPASAAPRPAGPAVPKAKPLSWQGTALLIWLAVLGAMLLLLLQRAFFVRRLVVQAAMPGGSMADLLNDCRQRMAVRVKVGLKLSAGATSPAVCGLFRPVILVPEKLTPSLSSSELHVVLLHELAHIKRRDLWVNFAQTLLQIFYFYNPLLWLANAIIRRVREQAVDEMVLVAMGEKARQYPATLVSVARLALRRPALSLRLIGVVESKSALTGRIKHILSRPFPKTARLGLFSLLIVVVAAAILLPMAAFSPGPPDLIIKGVVKDARTGKPIAGARVYDDGYGPMPSWSEIRPDERSEWGAITNDAGEYSFLTWPEHHSIRVEAPGYAIERESLYDSHFTFRRREEKTIDFNLKPVAVGVTSSGQAMNTDMPADAKGRLFTVYGMVTDEAGRPMEGVHVTADCGHDNLDRTCLVRTDKNGHYELHPTSSIINIGWDPYDIGIQDARIQVYAGGFYEDNLCRGGYLAMAGKPPDPNEQRFVADYAGVILPHEPYELDFVMNPAVGIQGELVDQRGGPLSGASLLLQGDTSMLPQRDISVWSRHLHKHVRIDKDGRFVIRDAPCGLFKFVCFRGGKSAQSGTVDLAAPGTYQVKLQHEESASGESHLKIAQFYPPIPIATKSLQAGNSEDYVSVKVEPSSSREQASKGIYRWRIDPPEGYVLDHGWFSFIDGEMKEHAGGGRDRSGMKKVVEFGLDTSIEEGFLVLKMHKFYTGQNMAVTCRTPVPQGSQLESERLSRYRPMTNTQYRSLWEGRFVRNGETVKTVVYCARIAALDDEVEGFYPEPAGQDPEADLGVPKTRVRIGKPRKTSPRIDKEITGRTEKDRVEQLAHKADIDVEHDQVAAAGKGRLVAGSRRNYFSILDESNGPRIEKRIYDELVKWSEQQSYRSEIWMNLVPWEEHDTFRGEFQTFRKSGRAWNKPKRDPPDVFLKVDLVKDGIWYVQGIEKQPKEWSSSLRLELLVAEWGQISPDQYDTLRAEARRRFSAVRKPNSKWTTLLSNGVKVELVGVSDFPSPGKKWWAPDGSQIGYDPVFHIQNYPQAYEFRKQRGSKRFEVAFAISWPKCPNENKIVDMFIDDVQRLNRGGLQADNEVIVQPVRFADDQKTFDVKIRISTDGKNFETATFNNVLLKPNQYESVSGEPGQLKVNVGTSQRDDAKIVGRVVDKEGQPVTGAQVALSADGIGVTISQGNLVRNLGNPTERIIVQTNSEGSFAFEKRPPEPFRLIAAHDKGFALVESEEFGRSNRIQLQPWGRIEGRLAKNPKNPIEVIYLSRLVDLDVISSKLHKYRYSAECDENGNFIFEKVPPDLYTAGYRIKDGNYTCKTPVEVRANETTHIIIGGSGRPVIGKLVLPEGYTKPIDFVRDICVGSMCAVEPKMPLPDNYKQMSFDERRRWRSQWVKTEEFREFQKAHFDKNWRAYPFNIDKDGSFRADDVIAGKYTLDIYLQKWDLDQNTLELEASYVGAVEIPEMPGGRSDKPLDLGELKLTKHEPRLTGRVVDKEGELVIGAQVALCTDKIGAKMSQGKLEPIRSEVGSRIVQTDADGIFDLGSKPVDSFVLIAAHDKGFAFVRSDEFVDSHDIRLRPWGRIEGHVANGRSASGNNIWMSSLPNSTWFLHKREYTYETEYDTDGRFVFEKVPAGWFEVGYFVRTGDSGWSITSRTPVEVKADETATITLGGSGRPVVGKFVPPAGYDKPIYFGNGLRSLGTTRPDQPRPADYDRMSKREQQQWRAQWRKSDEYKQYRDAYWHDPNWRQYTFRIKDDGSFRIDDVIAGKYDFTVWIEERLGGGGPREEIGSYYGTIEVPQIPGGRSDEPFDLGELVLTIHEPLRVGDTAPLFEAKTLDGKNLKLIDYRGKFVLLSFWQPVSHPELGRLKILAAGYNAVGRLDVIGLGGNDTLEEVRKYVAENEIPWPQIFVGQDFKSGIAKDYRIPGWPWIFLIGPDGKIIATGLRGEKLSSTVLEVLKSAGRTDSQTPAEAGRERQTACRTPTVLMDRLLELARAGDPAAGELFAENVDPEVTRLLQWYGGQANCEEMTTEYKQMRAELMAGLTAERKQFYEKVRIWPDLGDKATQVGPRACARLLKSNPRGESWIRTVLMREGRGGVWRIVGLLNRNSGLSASSDKDYLNPWSPAMHPAWGETTEYRISADDLARGCYVDFDDRTLHRMTPGSNLTRAMCVRLGIDGKCGSHEVSGDGGLIGIDLLVHNCIFTWGLITPLNVQLTSSLWYGLGSTVGGPSLIKTREGGIGVMSVSGDVNNYYIKFKMLNPACIGSAATIFRAVQSDPRETAAHFLVGGLYRDAELDVSSFVQHPGLITKVKSNGVPFGPRRLDTVYANNNVALAVTSKFGGDEYRRFVLSLSKETERWLVTDVQIETKSQDGEALRNFLQRNPDAGIVPSAARVEYTADPGIAFDSETVTRDYF